MIRAVMFDLDGTLLDTLADLGESMNTVLERQGYPPHELSFYRHAIGNGLPTLVRRSLPEAHRDEGTVQRSVGDMKSEYGRRWNVKTRPYDGVIAMLSAFSERGVLMAILTNKPDDAAQNVVRHFLPYDRFAVVRGVLLDGVVKPEPAGALAIVAASGIPRADWLYVGDTNTDMQTATNAGLFAVGCTWGFRDRDELLSNGADAIIDTPLELLDLASGLK